MSEFAKAFIRNYDGSWTCITHATLDDQSVPRMQVAQGATFIRGQKFMNVDLAGWLDEEALGEA